MALTSRSPVIAGRQVTALLQKLHSLADAEEKSWSQKFFYLNRLVRFIILGEEWSDLADAYMRDKFVALDADKCEFIYLLARASRAYNAIEAGTSYGISTMYLALAIGQNVVEERAHDSRISGKIIATEKEPAKAAKAREHWNLAGPEVTPWIELREGDLLETLKTDEDVSSPVDLLLLDIWTPLALPTLRLVQPRLKYGALVITDNTGMARALYKDFLGYLHEARNGFRSLTVPFSGGLEVSVYLPARV